MNEVDLKYERLESFCYIYGMVGYMKNFCDRLVLTCFFGMDGYTY